MAEGRLYSADNLDVLRGGYIAPESVDLIYLDPPFNSQRDYNILYKERDESPSRAQIKAFEDSWHWDANARDTYDELVSPEAQKRGIPLALSTIMRALHDALPNRSDMFAYLVMMAPRLVELRRVLKATGSLYLHCDPTASHYLKLTLDAVFGPTNFRSEIIWKRTTAHSSAQRYGPVHDVLLYYSKSEDVRWYPQHQPYDQKYRDTKYRFVDPASGKRYRLSDMTGSGTRTGESGQEWRGFNPTSIGRHWAISSHSRDKYLEISGKRLDGLSLLEQLDELDRVGLVKWLDKKGGRPEAKRFLDDMPGVALQDVWTDIDAINARAAERLGYPTQKPLALLERILAASSREGDVILDPFCGCGTAIEAAIKGHRKWIGIDITHLAIDVIRNRRLVHFPGLEYRLFSIPSDLETARACAAASPYEFQFWAARKIGAFVLGSDPHAREGKRGADRGVDGLIKFRSPSGDVEEAVISVKGGHVGPSVIRDLRGTMERRGAPIGVLLTLQEPTQPMKEEAGDAGSVRRGDEKYPRIQILTIADLFEGKRPQLPGQKERPTVLGQTLLLPGFEHATPPAPKGVLVKVPERAATEATPMVPVGERKAARKAPTLRFTPSRTTDVEE